MSSLRLSWGACKMSLKFELESSPQCSGQYLKLNHHRKYIIITILFQSPWTNWQLHCRLCTIVYISRTVKQIELWLYPPPMSFVLRLIWAFHHAWSKMYKGLKPCESIVWSFRLPPLNWNVLTFADSCRFLNFLISNFLALFSVNFF